MGGSISETSSIPSGHYDDRLLVKRLRQWKIAKNIVFAWPRDFKV